ncbi:fungal-specific transcription factor domain-containing protein [Aspergillus pseudoustus]|uniref:Fungal-specific transcription factor domain-containing protein n=1 Tax=Aspergillus pseudoustus TaxID=1810923 RepID=A0ABR4J6Y4_9EURO
MAEATNRKFICSWPECRRSFGKAEHLQRHQRAHTGDARHECPVCQKRFIRRDVMTRHAALHGEAVGLAKKTRKVSCKACAASKLRCDGAPGTTCRRCLRSGRPCLYISRDSTPPHPLKLDHFDATQTDTALETRSNQPLVPENSAISPATRARQTSVAYVDAPQPSVITGCAPLQGSAVGTIQSQAPDGFDFSLDRLYDFSIEPFESYMGWGHSAEDINIVRDFNEFSPVIPPACWPSLSTPMHSPAHSVPGTVPDVPNTTLIRDAQPADSPWPHVYKPSRDDEQLSITQVDPCSTLQPTSHWESPDHVDISTRDAILWVINNAHQSHWPTLDVSAFPSTRTLSICINFYFRHFHDTLPILCRSSFRSGEHSPVLLLAMAAIGAMYSPKRMAALAVALNELSRRAIVYLRESDRHLMFDTSIVQAWLLQSIFGLFCGSRLLYHHAEVSRGGLVTAARRMHLLRPGFSFVKELEQREAIASPDELEKARMKDEERCRLGWGIYLYDMQMSALLNISPHFSVGEIDISLPWNEDVWESRSPRTHDDSAQPPSDTLNFRHVLEHLLSVGKLPQPLSPFGLSIMAHTLHRLCSDAASLDSLCVSQPVENPSFYRLSFPANIKQYRDPFEFSPANS